MQKLELGGISVEQRLHLIKGSSLALSSAASHCDYYSGNLQIDLTVGPLTSFPQAVRLGQKSRDRLKSRFLGDRNASDSVTSTSPSILEARFPQGHFQTDF